ncbi:MAG: excisionase family DNA-binding protein [Chloroflexota bacterium]|nr:excisionase family DNA-binding protein [Chloroflexota bacterium]
MVARTRETESVTPTEQDVAAIGRLSRLVEEGGLEHARLLSSDGQTLDIPAPVGKALRQLIPLLARGEVITIASVRRQEEEAELSTVEAAALLRMSRPHLIKLLEAGAIPYHMVGTHRRFYYKDVVMYDEQRHKDALQLLDEMAAIAQEAGVYD